MRSKKQIGHYMAMTLNLKPGVFVNSFPHSPRNLDQVKEEAVIEEGKEQTVK